MSFIGLDLGTSFIKGAALNLDTYEISHVRRVPFPDPLPGLPPLRREFDPAAILAATRSLLADLLCATDRCEGIVTCSQMHGLVFTTERGEPASNLVNWQDQRVLEPHPSGQGTYFDVLARLITSDELRHLGNELRPGQPAGVLFWLAERKELPAADLIPASLPDFVLGNLCGATPGIESTNAAGHGALDMETLDWRRQVIGKLGLERVRWPILRMHGEVVGVLRAGGRAIPCYTPVGDYQAALTGALLQEGELSLNISTGAQVSTLKPQLAFGDYKTRPFFDGRYLAGITNVPAGRALAGLVRLLSELAVGQGITLSDPWGYIGRMAGQAGPTQMRADLAFFASDCGDRGAFTNLLEEELTVGHLFRAAFQNVADNCYASALRIAADRGWRNLVFSGGLVQKLDALRSLIVERFGVRYRVCPTSEDTLLGLLALGLAFTGRAASVAEATARIYAAYGGDGMMAPS